MSECLYEKWFVRIGIGIFIGLVILSYIDNVKTESYNEGHFKGFHESRFIDCTKPLGDQQMKVVFYEGVVLNHYEWFDWKELCDKLRPPMNESNLVFTYWTNNTGYVSDGIDEIKIQVYYEDGVQTTIIEKMNKTNKKHFISKSGLKYKVADEPSPMTFEIVYEQDWMDILR